ncbi:hypothetical protein [Spirochaeta isovalerica]|uniref:Uncharacterized protein n=1 Tax=Spirochaeta isovalerica TaxID=150 RepID=A0A841R7F2_9SPIO|nr:hypothetical protein [Spirochaeta isovalerica]MBB6479127.1 hypothetical protein [Spirochaeta isovalerica]
MKTPKLKVNFKLTDYVEPHIFKIYLFSLFSILMLAVLVVVGVTIFRSVNAGGDSSEPELYTEEDISAILKSPGLTDFIIPESLESGERGLTLYREPMKMWPESMVERYIIPPEELGIEKIREENRKSIENVLDDIP